MKLSLKVEYACRVLAQLARSHGQNKLHHIDELSNIEEIPKNYLVQILTELRTGGLISSRRGKQGGYCLVRAPEEISLYDIIRVVDAELLEMNFTTQGQSGPEVARIWESISEDFEARTRTYSLKSFLPDEGQAMFYI